MRRIRFDKSKSASNVIIVAITQRLLSLLRKASKVKASASLKMASFLELHTNQTLLVPIPKHSTVAPEERVTSSFDPPAYETCPIIISTKDSSYIHHHK
jgi:hypothetical protein